MIEAPDHLPPDYRTARTAFLTAAEAAGAELHSTVHPLTGLDGEDLAVDVAILAPEAQARVLVVSATHGVEGYGGSVWLRRS